MPRSEFSRYSECIEATRHKLHNGDGWLLDLRRYARHVDPTRRPVLLVPGYCMNITPVVFHPTGPSLVEYLTRGGLEVWTVNLRGQGDAKSVGGARNVGFETLALVDLKSAIDAVLQHTTTNADRLDAIGCSLGGTFLYTYLAHHLNHRIGAMVGLGAPLVWPRFNPVLRAAISPRIIGRVRVFGTRRAARRLLPVAAKLPALLSVYMNTAHVGLDHIDRLVDTVEDPIPRLNREIATWMKRGRLDVAGVDVAAATRGLNIPILSVYANRDGIVPPRAAASIRGLVGDRATLLEVGDDTTWYAHTDLFVGRTAKERVFHPVRAWLDSVAALSDLPESP